ncbi:MAG: ABC transporter ATP-binding protein [Acutalibacteraceae bacterium]|jgi:macrolide export ATP-binding/permease protein macB
MIEIKDLHKTYSMPGNVECHALNGLSLQVEDGEILAIIGKSGAGKSTLLHMIGCIDDFDSGSVVVDDMELARLSDGKRAEFRNSRVGIVLQDFALIPEYTVQENVAVPLIFSKDRKKVRERVAAALEEVGMKEYISKKANQLSGGQKQRVAIARAIVNNPRYILADEPTGALDTETSRQVMDTLIELNRKGTTIIVITHDPDIAALCTRSVRIEDGRVVD